MRPSAPVHSVSTPEHLQPRQASSPSNQSPTLGHVGPWHLVEQLGEGALSRVFRARTNSASADGPACYAVKFLRPEWYDHPAAVQVMRREAYLGRIVSHPHVIPVLATSVLEPPYYLAMPYLAGSTLAEEIGRGDLPELPAALWIARQVAEGLAALHETAGVIHADVKPSNIFLGADGHVTLLDLGLARAPDRPESIADRPVVGTLHYVAPEMITSALAADVRSDIYSLGATLYETLCGQVPLPAADPSDIPVLHRGTAPAPLQQRVPNLPDEVAQLVHQMLAKEPLRRPQTLREVADRLAALEIATFDLRRSA